MSTTSRLLAFVLLACSPALAFAAPPPVEVTTCGQAVPRNTVGYLTADLDCTGYDGAPGAVMLGRKATLELRGFTITGGRFTVLCGELRPDRFGDIRLYIDSRCTVIGGGGTVRNAEAHGITANALTVSSLTVVNAGEEGIHTRQKGLVTDVTVTGSGGQGIRIDRAARVHNSTVTGSGEEGIVSQRKIRISNSTVVDNGTSLTECDFPWDCADIASGLRPQVVDTVCNTSRGPDRTDWDVCALD